MANENKPLVEVKPGDPITAGRWNDMQRALRQEHIAHAHTGAWKDGLFDGAPLTAAGLADGAVTNPRLADNAVSGAKVDPSSDLHIRKLTITIATWTFAIILRASVSACSIGLSTRAISWLMRFSDAAKRCL